MYCLSPFCYICLKSGSTLKKLDSLDTDDIFIKDKLNFCIFMQEKSYLNIPLYICQICHRKLNIAFYFREMGLRSNDLINDYISQFNDLGSNTYNQLQIDMGHINEVSNYLETYNYNDSEIFDETNSDIESIDSSINHSESNNNLDNTDDMFSQISGDDNLSINEQVDEIILKIKDDSLFIETDQNIFEKQTEFVENDTDFESKVKTEDVEISDTETVILQHNINDQIHKRNLNDSFKIVEEEMEKMFNDDLSDKEVLIKNQTELPEKSDEVIKDIFRCRVCNIVFKNKKSLAWHFQIHKDILTVEETQKNNGLKSIKNDLNTPKDVYLCKICNTEFTKEINFKWHKKIHEKLSNKNKFKCNVCPVSFPKHVQLNAHSKIHGKKRFQCDKCDRKYISEASLKNHYRIHIEEPKYKCKYCARLFHQKGMYDYHIRNHLGIKPYSCNICDKKFTSSIGMNNHTIVHTGIVERNFKCTICSKSFNTKWNLKNHMYLHSPIKHFKCKVCEKLYKTLSHLHAHMRSHMPKTHECDVCHKKFKSKVLLKHHKIMHSNVTYKCPECDKCFVWKQCFQTHIKRHQLEKYTCDICGLKFVKQEAYELHVVNIHSIFKRFSCHVCEKRFTTKDNLKNHVLNIHKDVLLE